jgi:hypothetical protein
MASKIRIFRSTGATAPSAVDYGELAVTVEDGTAGTSANKAGRLFIGNASGNPVELGGEYTYKLMDHAHGSLINSSVAIVDSNGQIDGWNVAGILTATRTSITDLVAGNLNITGVATFSQGLNLNGDVTIGDSHTDTLTVNSRAGFNTDATFNSALLVSGISTFSGLVDSNGGANVSGGAGLVVSADGANVTGVSTFNSAVLFQSSIDVDGQAIFDDVTVSAASTFTGLIDANGGINVTGAESIFSSATVSDLTSGRVVLAGTSGALEDSSNLTFDGSTLTVTGEIIVNSGVSTFAGPIDANVGVDISGGSGLVVSADGLNVTGVSTFNNNVEFAGTIDVDGQTILDDVTVSAAATFTGAVDMNGGLDVSGGETVLSSATVSDLTQDRVVLAGASGALTDNANLTFASNILDVDGTVDAGTALRSPVGVITALTSSDVVSAAGTFTSAFTLGSGGTKYSFPVADGSVDQILVTNGSGSLTFQDVPSSMVISAGAAGTDRVNLLVDTFTVAATNNETRTTLTDNTITVGLATDIIVGGGVTISNDLLVLGNLTVEGTETIINVERLDVQDKTIGVASTATASNTTANGGGFFVHAGSDGDKTIFWNLTQGGFEVNQDWLPDSDGSLDLGNASREWQNLFVDGLAELDDVNVSAAATINTLNVTGTGTIATADINGGNIDGTVIGAASSAAATFTTVNYTSLTGGDITATGSRVTAGDVTFTNLRVTGVSTVADLFLSTGTNTNGVAYFDANGQVTSTATPSAGIQTSNFILTTNASGVPSWTDTIDCGQF